MKDEVNGLKLLGKDKELVADDVIELLILCWLLIVLLNELALTSLNMLVPFWLLIIVLVDELALLSLNMLLPLREDDDKEATLLK